MQQSYLYRAVQVYNKLPKELTLIRNKNLFKKWLRRYNMNNLIKLKQQDDFIIDDENENEIEDETCDNNENIGN